MKTCYIFIFCFFIGQKYNAQLLLNGEFLLGATFWFCNPEINAETVYGGTNILNSVAEIDAGAGLCQTVNGLTIGKIYSVSFDASRRQAGSCAPAITNVNVTVSDGALVATVTRTNTTWGFTRIGYLFLASKTSHEIAFSAGSGFGSSTCGMIIDNISVAISALPVELMKFEGIVTTNSSQLIWSTATERNNSHFEIEKSRNGTDFESVATITTKAKQGNSSSRLDYEATDTAAEAGINYYRLKQVDADQTFSYSKIIALSNSKEAHKGISVYPNPNNGEFTIDVVSERNNGEVNIKMIGSMGRIVYSENYPVEKGSNSIKINAKSRLAQGNYHCLVLLENKSHNFPVLID